MNDRVKVTFRLKVIKPDGRDGDRYERWMWWQLPPAAGDVVEILPADVADATCTVISVRRTFAGNFRAELEAPSFMVNLEELLLDNDWELVDAEQLDPADRRRIVGGRRCWELEPDDWVAYRNADGSVDLVQPHTMLFELRADQVMLGVWAGKPSDDQVAAANVHAHDVGVPPISAQRLEEIRSRETQQHHMG